MGTDIARFRQCAAEVPDPKRRQPLVSCKEPHRGELLLTLMELEASEYPPAAKLKRAGQSQCRELAADRDDADALGLTPHWLGEDH